MKNILFILFFCCSNIYSQIDSVSIFESTSKKDIPSQYYRFLGIDSIKQIADPGEDWDPGCVIVNDLPRQKFHWIAKDKFGYMIILISRGGIGVHTTCIIVNTKKNSAIKYNGVQLDGGLTYKEIYRLIKSDILDSRKI